MGPVAVTVVPELVQGKVKGFVATHGKDLTDPGQVYPFRIDVPIPQCSSPNWTTFGVSVGVAGGQSHYVVGLSDPSYIPKRFGIQGARAEPQLSFFCVSRKYISGSQNVPWHMVSVVDTVTDVFNPPGDDKDIALLDPDDPNDPNDPYSGRVPEGIATITTSVAGVRYRACLAQAYHEGTLAILDWSSVTNVHVVQEFEIDRTHGAPGGVGMYLGLDPAIDPSGNLNRPVAVVQKVPSGPNQGKRLAFIGLNFDPCNVLDDGDPQTSQNCPLADEDEDPDEGPYDYVVTIDFTNWTGQPLPGSLPPSVIRHTRLNAQVPYANWGTVSGIAAHSDGDRVYVVTKNQGPEAVGAGNAESPWLYVLDVTQGPPHPVTFTQSIASLIGASCPSDEANGLRPSGGRPLFVRNPFMSSAPKDRLYVPMNRSIYGQTSLPSDGFIAVFDCTNRDQPVFLDLISLHDQDSQIDRDTIDLAALPIEPAVLDSDPTTSLDLERTLLVATVYKSGSADTGYLAIVEDR